jgi:hypothetical protein
MIEGSGSGSIPLDPDPDPGGPETWGFSGSGSEFGSATLGEITKKMELQSFFFNISTYY